MDSEKPLTKIQANGSVVIGDPETVRWDYKGRRREWLSGI
jgi:hypothetical protein